MVPGDRLLRVEEIAQYLRISRSQAYNLVRRGDLAHVRVSPGCVRVRPEDLQAFLAARRSGEEGSR